jgi:hypothetical protein
MASQETSACTVFCPDGPCGKQGKPSLHEENERRRPEEEHGVDLILGGLQLSLDQRQALRDGRGGGRSHGGIQKYCSCRPGRTTRTTACARSRDYLRPARPDTQPARTTHPRITAAYSHHTSTTHTHAPNPTNYLTNRQKQPDNTGPKGKKTHNTAHQKDDEGNAPSRESENGTKVARLMCQSSR